MNSATMSKNPLNQISNSSYANENFFNSPGNPDHVLYANLQQHEQNLMSHHDKLIGSQSTSATLRFYGWPCVVEV